MKVVVTIEARMSSRRLPGKVLLPAAGRPFLSHMIERVKQVPGISEIVIATTDNPADSILEKFAQENCVSVFRGSEEDVMGRVLAAAEMVSADVIVELTGDCPIIDPAIIDDCVQLYLSSDCDYVSNCVERSYPDGMDVQVFSVDALRKSADMTVDPFDREHVTLHIRRSPDIFKMCDLVAPKELTWPELGLTLDEQADYEMLKVITEELYISSPFFSCEDVIDFLRRRPEVRALNQTVSRTVYE